MTYQLPFGRGKKFFSGANRLVNEAIGGWEINDEWIDQNGVPLTIQQSDLSTTFGTTGVGGTYQRPNLVGDVHAACVPGRPQGRLGVYYSGRSETPYVNAAAFTPAAPYTYGNAPRMLPCRAPGYDNQNLAVYKDIRLSERFNLQFRAEALNVFNTPEFAPPSLTYSVNTPASVTASPVAPTGTAQPLGNITTTIGFARIIQMGGRLSF